MTATLFIDNDMVVEITGVQDEDGNTITGGTGTAKVFKDEAATAQVGGDVTLSDDGGGVYSGTIPDTLSLVDGKLYFVKIALTKAPRNGVWIEPARARYRRFSDS